MAITHNFNDEVNYAEGGQWCGDYGESICEWFWNADTKVLTVECGDKGRRVDLSSHMPSENLRSYLPSKAIEIAEDVLGTTFEN